LRADRPSSHIWLVTQVLPEELAVSARLLAMARAVIFDFYGTLAHWRDRPHTTYPSAFANHGYELPAEQLDAYFARWDGVEHAEHSVNEAAYEAWVRTRLHELTAACEVDDADREPIIDALRAMDHSPMVAYPEAALTLQRVRKEGWSIGVCSNWGWELDSFLREVGLIDLIDSSVTSARAGARKPHPSIFAQSADALGVEMRDAVFVGDSWAPDVEGPRRVGMTAVHVWREEEQHGRLPPELPSGAHRIASLSELLPVLSLRLR
jgi:putative hydrolase of the HAD superfamily